MADTERRLRILIAKPGLDGHDRGAKVVARALRDAGFEVIYTGLHNTVEEIADAALQEDCDVTGLSILSGSHIPLTRNLMATMEALGLAGDIAVVVGGTIPPADVPELQGYAVDAVFPVGTPLDRIVQWFADFTVE